MKTFVIPGSKSLTNRVLLLAALSRKPTLLSGVLKSDDTTYMQKALEAFGVVFQERGAGVLQVLPPEQFSLPEAPLFIGNAGTAARSLACMSLLLSDPYTLDGVARMRERPFGDLFRALRQAGVRVDSKIAGHLPTTFTGTGGRVKRDTLTLSGKVSSQFLTGLLLVSPRLQKPVTLRIFDEVPSWPYVQMTLDILDIWGVKTEVSADHKEITVQPGLLSPGSFQIPADMSSASYPILYSLLSKTPLCIQNIGQKTFQGDEHFCSIAEQFGAKIQRDDNGLQIRPPKELLALGTVDFSSMPDVSMTAMALAACARGETTFTGLESLRVKECDRIAAMEQLRVLGVDMEVREDQVTIKGNPKFLNTDTSFDGREINSFDDHRIAMVFGVLRVALNANFRITKPSCVAKTWPDFWRDLADWQGLLRPVSAVILQRGTGKQKEYLLVKKPRKNHAWQFPQGGCDKEENALSCAKRELLEECGAALNVDFQSSDPVGSYRYLFPKNFKRHTEGFVGAHVEFFGADYKGGDIQLSAEELEDFAWLSPEQIAERVEPSYWEVIRPFLKH